MSQSRSPAKEPGISGSQTSRSTAPPWGSSPQHFAQPISKYSRPKSAPRERKSVGESVESLNEVMPVPHISKHSQELAASMSRKGPVFTRLYTTHADVIKKRDEEKKRLDKMEEENIRASKVQINTLSKEMMKGRSATGFSNYGELLYSEGRKRREDRDKRLQEMKKKQEEEVDPELTLHPKITSKAERVTYSSRSPAWERLNQIAKRAVNTREQKKKQLESEELAECTFQPQISKRSNRMMQMRTTEHQQHGNLAHFDHLYTEAIKRRTRAEIYNQWLPQEVTFHPNIGKRSRELAIDVDDASFLNRLTYSRLERDHILDDLREMMAAPVDPVDGQPLFHPRTGRPPKFRRQGHSPSEGSVNASMEEENVPNEEDILRERIRRRVERERADKDRAAKYSPPRPNTSSSLHLHSHRKRLTRIFDALDTKGRGVLDLRETDVSVLDADVATDIRSILQTASTVMDEVTLDEFCKMVDKYLKQQRPRGYLWSQGMTSPQSNSAAHMSPDFSMYSIRPSSAVQGHIASPAPATDSYSQHSAMPSERAPSPPATLASPPQMRPSPVPTSHNDDFRPQSVASSVNASLRSALRTSKDSRPTSSHERPNPPPSATSPSRRKVVVAGHHPERRPSWQDSLRIGPSASPRPSSTASVQPRSKSPYRNGADPTPPRQAPPRPLSPDGWPYVTDDSPYTKDKGPSKSSEASAAKKEEEFNSNPSNFIKGKGKSPKPDPMARRKKLIAEARRQFFSSDDEDESDGTSDDRSNTQRSTTPTASSSFLAYAPIASSLGPSHSHSHHPPPPPLPSRSTPPPVQFSSSPQSMVDRPQSRQSSSSSSANTHSSSSSGVPSAASNYSAYHAAPSTADNPLTVTVSLSSSPPPAAQYHSEWQPSHYETRDEVSARSSTTAGGAKAATSLRHSPPQMMHQQSRSVLSSSASEEEDDGADVGDPAPHPTVGSLAHHSYPHPSQNGGRQSKYQPSQNGGRPSERPLSDPHPMQTGKQTERSAVSDSQPVQNGTTRQSSERSSSFSNAKKTGNGKPLQNGKNRLERSSIAEEHPQQQQQQNGKRSPPTAPAPAPSSEQVSSSKSEKDHQQQQRPPARIQRRRVFDTSSDEDEEVFKPPSTLSLTPFERRTEGVKPAAALYVSSRSEASKALDSASENDEPLPSMKKDPPTRLGAAHRHDDNDDVPQVKKTPEPGPSPPKHNNVAENERGPRNGGRRSFRNRPWDSDDDD